MPLLLIKSLNVINMRRRTIFAQKNSNLKSEILPNKNFQFNQKFNKKILNKKSENQNKLEWINATPFTGHKIYILWNLKLLPQEN